MIEKNLGHEAGLELVVSDGDKMQFKLTYSQPAFPLSLDRLKARGQLIEDATASNSSSHVFKENRRSENGEEEEWIIEYDAKGRPIKEVGPNGSYVRKYDEHNYITSQSVRVRDHDNPQEWIEEEHLMTYGYQEGMIAVQRIKVTPFRVEDGVRGKKIHPAFVINLADVSPRLPLKKSVPSF